MQGTTNQEAEMFTNTVETFQQDTETHCHRGAHKRGSDHCHECGCEEFESQCDHRTVEVARRVVR